jgi:hypothetical protein
VTDDLRLIDTVLIGLVIILGHIPEAIHLVMQKIDHLINVSFIFIELFIIKIARKAAVDIGKEFFCFGIGSAGCVFKLLIIDSVCHRFFFPAA